MFSPHFESWGRDSSHAGWGCQFSINLLPRLICRLHSESAWDHFSAMQSWWKVPTWPAIWGQTGELICASSPSGRAQAALLHLHLLIFSTTFVSCSCLMSLIPPPPGFWFIPLLFFCLLLQTHPKKVRVSHRQGKQSEWWFSGIWLLCTSPWVLPSALFLSLLLLRRSQSFTPFSLMAPAKTLPQDKHHPPPHPQPSSSSPPPPMKKT